MDDSALLSEGAVSREKVIWGRCPGTLPGTLPRDVASEPGAAG
jgi:hypothetical protein